MKRILFCAGILALAASCTESELDTISVQEGSKNGITFQAVEEGGENASTRGGWTPGADNTYVPIWHAETDKIAVFATGVKKESAEWTTFAADKFATYKATKSAGAGQFTGIEDAEILNFLPAATEEAPAKFVALYPTSLATDLTFAGDKFTAKIGATDLAAQTQSDITGGGVYSIFPKWSATTAFPKQAWDAVGEKIALDFQRPLSGLVFSVKNADKYTKGGATSIFGLLQTVTITAKGDVKDEKTNDISGTADLLTLNSDATLEINVKDMTATKPVKPTAKLIAGTAGATTPAKSKIVLTMGTAGLEWSDEAKAYMVIAPIERTDKKQYFTVAYEFDNITITVDAESSKSWKAGSFYNFPVLDLSDAKYDHLVTGEGSSRVLTINKGSLTSMMTADGTAVKWGANDAVINANQFTTIICDAVLTPGDLKLLQNFTSLVNVTLNANTEIPAGTFKAAGLKSINMPMVTKINKTGFTAVTALDSLKLKEYKFDDAETNKLFFTTGAKTSLKTLDLSAVANMKTAFGSDVTLNFDGFTALKSVTLQDKVVLSQNAFNGCTALVDVKGAVQLASNAFKNCALLKEINVEGTVIPEGAFENCTELVLVNKGEIVPTEVGVTAFKGTKIKFMDMSKIAKLGKSAFENVATLEGASKDQPILTVGAVSIPADAFKGCIKITKIDFTNATSFEAGILMDCTLLNQVRFHKAFTVKPNSAWGTTFGASTAYAAAIQLFVVADQDYLDDENKKALLLPLAAKTDLVDATFTKVEFKAIN